LTVGNVPISIDSIEVLIQHPYGDAWIPLNEWITRGPGPRPLLAPAAAREKHTKKALPIDVIPLRYRNDDKSRRLLETGELKNPWPEEL